MIRIETTILTQDFTVECTLCLTQILLSIPSKTTMSFLGVVGKQFSGILRDLCPGFNFINPCAFFCHKRCHAIQL